ncbi:LptF/LptG family permease [Mucilaginibacter ginsenosidivorans]|uniref:YjgP/YjgQ family permease n=1 Tax=Mucilaginibacter ginsenosidivorans TaxID=398053 RepID=A0A5B8V0Z6_9SPHI|nr:LptF/LptG family permease [Mucilaginibacter ginsenosidivorans]QEC64858.1 YjgP/YjgQ family permease [Mucilaginibacter ginsenosidivorans]
MKRLFSKYLKVIDWYIINKYLGTFVFTLGIFTVITVVFDIAEHIDNFLKSGASLHDIAFKYYAGFIPFYLNLLEPLINFIAVILFTARMANQTEIVPILSSKASFARFLRPYFVSASLIFVVSLFANVYLIPFTNRLKVDFENKNFSDGSDPSKSEVHMQLDKHTFVFVKSFDNSTKTGFEFIMEKFNGDTMTEKWVAQNISYDSLKRKWTLKNYSLRRINGLKESMIWHGAAKDTTLDMKPVDFEIRDNAYSAMSTQLLNKNIEKAKLRGTGELMDMEFEKYNRFVYPLSTFVLTLIGVSMSSRKVRGGIGLPLGIGILLCFAYIVVERFALVFSTKGGAPALLSVFVPNVLFGILGYVLLLKAPK